MRFLIGLIRISASLNLKYLENKIPEWIEDPATSKESPLYKSRRERRDFRVNVKIPRLQFAI
jgi:hypothetical protein